MRRRNVGLHIYQKKNLHNVFIIYIYIYNHIIRFSIQLHDLRKTLFLYIVIFLDSLLETLQDFLALKKVLFEFET